MSTSQNDSIPRKNDNQWIEIREGREVTVTEHPVRDERVEFLNEPENPEEGLLTLKFYLGVGHTVDEHTHPKQTETLTVNQGAIRATIDGDERVLNVGDNAQIPPGTPHGYTVISDQAAILAVSITPALSFKEFVVAEHALSADDYPESGLNLPYFSVVSKRYGPMIDAPQTGLVATLFGVILSVIARLKRLKIPNEPLPVREPTADTDDETAEEPPTS